ELLQLASVIEVLSNAGSRWNWRPFRITFCSARGGLIDSSSQAPVNTIQPSSGVAPELLLVTAGRSRPTVKDAEETSKTFARFQRQEHPELLWVALGKGLNHLVREGLCRGRRLAAPRTERAQLTALDPSVVFVEQSWHRDGPIVSCATTDAIPVGLHLVEHFFGKSTARAVRDELS